MKAIILKEFGSADNLQVVEVPTPEEIAENEVLIQVKAFSVNPLDAHVREIPEWWKLVSGSDVTEPYVILGWDVAGIVTKTGKNVTKFKEGDAVYGLINFLGRGNAYAEYVAAPESHLALKPENISFEAAASATMAAQTAWVSLVHYGNIKKGDKVVITGASGGVGHYAVQIAKSFGAYVVAVSSGENKDWVLSLGADEYVDYKTQHFEEIVKDADLVHDAVWRADESHLSRSLIAIKPGGTLLSLMVFPSPEFITAAKEQQNITVVRANLSDTPDKQGDIEAINALLSSGKIKSHVSGVFSMDEISKAHHQIETHSTVGKIVVTV
ncbi:NADP-dependent oxidoreductase [Parapedobacter koreensis]|uniref:NADPH:quinone reductase n=1 Tax=Parapedobacter koreensis TaxID=332977 RepID=A0A1H7TEA4_9SPHI|nr:NADP-dependent oxidoreductase [Parapedobacter koreensis]SEL83212.1 NADPH:quinone reductase [Parapedobacter koreensis]